MTLNKRKMISKSILSPSGITETGSSKNLVFSRNLLLEFCLAILLFTSICVYNVKAEEKEDDPTFILNEEVIMGKEKEQNKNEGKKDTKVEEKYELEKSYSEKMIPDILMNERQLNVINTQKKRRFQNGIDVSAGNYYGFNLHLNHKQNLNNISYSLNIDKEYGNKCRPDSIYDYYTFGGQLFSEKIDFDFKLNYNKFDLPGMITGRFSELYRKCNNYQFGLGVKTVDHVLIVLTGENTNIKGQINRKNQTIGVKSLYEFNKKNSPYLVTSEAEENKLSGQYHYWYYSVEMENKAIVLDDKSQLRAGAGISREGGEKLYLNPKLACFYKYTQSTDFEAGFIRQNEKSGFYELYGKNNYAEINPAPVKRMNYWQIYYKANKQLENNNSLDVKIFHDWMSNYIGFDEDEANLDGFWLPVNIGNIQREGLVISYNQKFLRRFSGEVNFKYSELRNDNKFKTVPGAANEGGAVVKYDNQLYQFSINGKYNGKRYYDKDLNEKLGGYFLLGIMAEKEISMNLTIYAKADNILDKRYEIVKQYPGERAKLLLGCKYIF